MTEREHIERRTVTMNVAELEELMVRAVSRGVESGFDNLLADKEKVKHFWKEGFDELLDHSTNNTKQWVGGALMKWLAGILFVAALTLALKFGGGK